ncbi:hypothetical protein [Ectopseudomonas alcaliphila]|uniref:Uncharacterized protein n=1 Tax=Ectopseudomonas alcaliphila TaxID=101564 RepID=A0A1G6V9Z6_9GAMM|nr:hypothetical protein [Pseudomonas alcaliphila]MDX5991724.1 hypothetical protein [Pseudomonas alcaliphila]SDD49646.1 hypothetical protein SAMN05216575_101683 [Pseudomonas alcaliphila]
MNLLELVARYPQRAEGGVPDWMLGHFRRRTISFADGRSDQRTQVHWLQSRSFTLDLRLPEVPALPVRAWQDYDAAELRQLANHEGWVADSVWEDGYLSWHGGVSLQLHNRWPEPAQLQRIGNCMIEFGTSGAYVEDWRLQASSGPLIGLRLVEECDAESGEVLQRGGGLILCGEQLGWVHGRAVELAESALQLRERVELAQGDGEALAALFDCEASLAYADQQGRYQVALSTLPARVGQMVSLEGFELSAAGRVCQYLQRPEGRAVVRTFLIDTLEPDWRADLATPTTDEAQRWFAAEGETLSRYLEVLS